MKEKNWLITKYRSWLLIVALLGILGQIVLAKKVNDLVVLFLGGLLVWSIRQLRLKAGLVIMAGLFLVILCLFFLLFKLNLTAEKIAIWAFIFLLIGNLIKLYGFYQNGKQSKKN